MSFSFLISQLSGWASNSAQLIQIENISYTFFYWRFKFISLHFPGNKFIYISFMIPPGLFQPAFCHCVSLFSVLTARVYFRNWTASGWRRATYIRTCEPMTTRNDDENETRIAAWLKRYLGMCVNEENENILCCRERPTTLAMSE